MMDVMGCEEDMEIRVVRPKGQLHKEERHVNRRAHQYKYAEGNRLQRGINRLGFLHRYLARKQRTQITTADESGTAASAPRSLARTEGFETTREQNLAYSLIGKCLAEVAFHADLEQIRKVALRCSDETAASPARNFFV